MATVPVACCLALAIFCYSGFIPTVAGVYWGDWGNVECCPAPVTGFKLKTERPQGRGDDTALNSISLKCSASNTWISSSAAR